eukprot:GFYU01003131.1.p1 GENE.GFYU01003131.1~~GFYU01003131.1.p1  ORF type:complete len:235 (-),score=62.05 GFYU01003131.1:537-1241(-)
MTLSSSARFAAVAGLLVTVGVIATLIVLASNSAVSGYGASTELNAHCEPCDTMECGEGEQHFESGSGCCFCVPEDLQCVANDRGCSHHCINLMGWRQCAMYCNNDGWNVVGEFIGHIESKPVVVGDFDDNDECTDEMLDACPELTCKENEEPAIHHGCCPVCQPKPPVSCTLGGKDAHDMCSVDCGDFGTVGLRTCDVLCVSPMKEDGLSWQIKGQVQVNREVGHEDDKNDIVV